MTKLDDFRVGAGAKAEPEPKGQQWQTGLVLSFDQTLASTGWALIEFHEGFAPTPRRTGMFHTEEGRLKGHAANLARSEAVFREVCRLIMDIHPSVVVHEAPPVGGGRMSRPESSLLAADAIRHALIVCIEHKGRDIATWMVQAQTAKTFLGGARDAPKNDVRAGVLKHLPGLSGMKPANEHTYDAAALALTAMRVRES